MNNEDIYMKTKKLISMIFIAVIAILMVTVVLNTVQAVDAAPKKVKVTWDANGGKIDSTKTKVTTVKKNANVGKLIKAPKRTGYEFKGWYTKKSGGTKITAKTKVKKKVTYYAQWKKKANANIDSKLLGSWSYTRYYSMTSYSSEKYYFWDNGTFLFTAQSSQLFGTFSNSGKYKVSNGKITFTNVVTRYASGKEEKYPDTVAEYKFVKESDGTEYLRISRLVYSDRNYLDYETYWCSWRKAS